MRPYHGFIRVAAGTPSIKVAHVQHNVEQVLETIREADKEGVQVLTLPELVLTGYTCADLFFQPVLIQAALQGLIQLKKETKPFDMVIAIGLPLMIEQKLYNVMAVLYKGEILGIVPKSHLPNYGEFYEKRWFHEGLELQSKTIDIQNHPVPVGTDLLFVNQLLPEMCIGLEICEDLWVTIPPSNYLCANGATLILNGSASNELVGKHQYRKELIKQQSARCMTAYVYSSAGATESSTDVVFSGANLIYENGQLLSESKRFCFDNQLTISDVDLQLITAQRLRQNTFSHPMFQRPYRKVMFQMPVQLHENLKRVFSPLPFVPQQTAQVEEHCKEIYEIQIAGLMKRMLHTNMKKVVIGVSGGLDSTWALLVCHGAFKRLGIPTENILGITMPGFGTTGRTLQNALHLMRLLHLTIREVDIKKASEQHFLDIGHDPAVHDITYENTQARERTQILMDIANKEGALVIGTGDLSEQALGWMTYNGDHMSMYAVNSGIPKTLIRCLTQWKAQQEISKICDLLFSILDTPISPELLPANANGEIEQLTENSVGEYDLNDFFLYHMLKSQFEPLKILYLAELTFQRKYTPEYIHEKLKNFYKRFFTQQFKRSCMPDGIKVGSVALSPRGDWRMPSDACYEVWMNQIDNR